MLARNKRTVAYTETDGEKVAMVMKQQLEAAPKGESSGQAANIATIKDRSLAMVLGDPFFYELLSTQNAAPITWMVSPQWNVAWLHRLLTSPSGGVCDVAL